MCIPYECIISVFIDTHNFFMVKNTKPVLHKLLYRFDKFSENVESTFKSTTLFLNVVVNYGIFNEMSEDCWKFTII